MDLVGKQNWDMFNSLIGKDSFDTFGQAIIIWRRQLTNVDRYNEDNESAQFVDIPLPCLVNYNYMRSWPISNMTESGQLEAQSIQVLFSKKVITDLGYTNTAGYFDYQPDFDRFVLDGIIRKPKGDSSVSQAHDGSLIFEIIMTELKTPTGESRT